MKEVNKHYLDWKEVTTLVNNLCDIITAGINPPLGRPQMSLISKSDSRIFEYKMLTKSSTSFQLK